MKNNYFLTIVIVVVGAIGFYGGTKYQQNSRPTFNSQTGFRQQGFQTGSQTGDITNQTKARQVIGDILSKDDKSITVKLQNGSSKIIFLSNTTTINKATSAAITDLVVGEKVGVFGLENSDGSVTANSIQLDPVLRNQNTKPPGQ